MRNSDATRYVDAAGESGSTMTAAEISERMSQIGEDLATNNRYGGYPKARELEAEWEYLKSNYERVLTSGGTLERFAFPFRAGEQ